MRTNIWGNPYLNFTSPDCKYLLEITGNRINFIQGEGTQVGTYHIETQRLCYKKWNKYSAEYFAKDASLIECIQFMNERYERYMMSEQELKDKGLW